MRSKLFYDAEFTGLHQSSTLISLAFCDEHGREFYAEFSDFDRSQCDGWIEQHVLPLTRWLNQDQAELAPFVRYENHNKTKQKQGELCLCFGDSAFVKATLLEWLSAYDSVEVWADCLAWDWVLFCELFGGALSIPKQIFYMPFDLAMLFYCKGFDADTPRLEFAKQQGAIFEQGDLHNALFDARLAKICYGFLHS